MDLLGCANSPNDNSVCPSKPQRKRGWTTINMKYTDIYQPIQVPVFNRGKPTRCTPCTRGEIKITHFNHSLIINNRLVTECVDFKEQEIFSQIQK